MVYKDKKDVYNHDNGYTTKCVTKSVLPLNRVSIILPFHIVGYMTMAFFPPNGPKLCKLVTLTLLYDDLDLLFQNIPKILICPAIWSLIHLAKRI